MKVIPCLYVLGKLTVDLEMDLASKTDTVTTAFPPVKTIMGSSTRPKPGVPLHQMKASKTEQNRRLSQHLRLTCIPPPRGPWLLHQRGNGQLRWWKSFVRLWGPNLTLTAGSVFSLQSWVHFVSTTLSSFPVTVASCLFLEDDEWGNKKLQDQALCCVSLMMGTQ